MNGLRAISPEEMVSSKQEFFVDFTDRDDPQPIVKLKNILLDEKNENRAMEIKSTDDQHFNILRIFLDTVSRNTFHRRYPKTIKFLKQFDNSENKDLKLYEFFQLHSIAGNTYPNLFASTYGTEFIKWKTLFMKRISTYARDQGYVTGFAGDACFYSEVDLQGNHFTPF